MNKVTLKEHDATSSRSFGMDLMDSGAKVHAPSGDVSILRRSDGQAGLYTVESMMFAEKCVLIASKSFGMHTVKVVWKRAEQFQKRIIPEIIFRCKELVTKGSGSMGTLGTASNGFLSSPALQRSSG